MCRFGPAPPHSLHPPSAGPDSPPPPQEGSLSALSHPFEQLRGSGLLVSISPAADTSTERAAAAIRWMARVAAKSSALADPIVDALLSPPPRASLAGAAGPGEAPAAAPNRAPETGSGLAAAVGSAAAPVAEGSTAAADPTLVVSGLRAIADVDRRFTLPSTPGLLQSAPHIERRAVILARDQIWANRAPPLSAGDGSAGGAASGRRSAVAATGVHAASSAPGETEEAPRSLVAAALAAACGAPDAPAEASPPTAAPICLSPSFLARPVAVAARTPLDAAAAAARVGPTGDARIDDAAGWAQLIAAQAKTAAEASGVRTVLLPPSTPAEGAFDRQPPGGTLLLQVPAAAVPRPSAQAAQMKLRVRLPATHRSAGTRFAWQLPCACHRHVARFSIATEGAATAVVPWDASLCELQMPGMDASERAIQEGPRGVWGGVAGGGGERGGAPCIDDSGGGCGQGDAGGDGDSGGGGGVDGRCAEVDRCPTVLWWLMEADALLPRALTAELHRLYLACLCVPAFRLAFARTFSHLYFPLALRWVLSRLARSRAWILLSPFNAVRHRRSPGTPPPEARASLHPKAAAPAAAIVCTASPPPAHQPSTPTPRRYNAGVGTKAETLLGLSTQLYTAPSLLLHTGPTAAFTSAMLSLDRLLHQASDLQAVETAAHYDATAAASLAAASRMPPAVATGPGGAARTGERPFVEGAMSLPLGPGPLPLASFRAPLGPHSPPRTPLITPGAAGSPAEWCALPPPSEIGAWSRAKRLSGGAEPEVGFNPLSGEPEAGLEPAPMPKLVCEHEALERRRCAATGGLERHMLLTWHTLFWRAAGSAMVAGIGSGSCLPWCVEPRGEGS